jgi:murein DD-endopeptidase MepM/ murein hydrolase activator NlpD
MKHLLILMLTALITLALLAVQPASRATAQSAISQHLVQPGDTWVALAWRYSVTLAAIQAANPHPNRQRQPVIGAVVPVPAAGPQQPGLLLRSGDAGLLATAVHYNTSPWLLAIRNNIQAGPYRPLFFRPIFIPGGTEAPRDLPPGFSNLELSQIPAHPGQALAFRAQISRPISATAALNSLPFTTFSQAPHFLGVGGTGAFFGGGQPELIIAPANAPAWSQGWLFVDNEWIYQELTLTGSAAAIDQASIQRERERLFALWARVTPEPQWTAPFQLPINNYLEISSTYGARRSYNGGPYRTYHEGLDFSAYGGTPVYAPAAGAVALAEILFVRGGAVILDHGLGIYSGFYHMSDVMVQPGQIVQPGQQVGTVGTTGLSTGNHLHWDLLVANTWVDPAAWLEQDTACWISAALGRPCLGNQ